MGSPRPTEPILRPAKRLEVKHCLPPNIVEREVREQLERVLAHPVFRNSKRNCSLLKHVVERTLEGRQEDLKERAIGVDVFGRSIDYDTNADHIVRSVAGEVRRRLAQYYMEPERESEIRIDLLAGSYVAQFRLPGGRSNASSAVTPVGPVELLAPFVTERPIPWWRSWPAAIGAALTIAICLSVLWLAGPKSAFEKFWSPFFSSANSALLCVGGGQTNPAVPTDPMMTLSDFERQPSRRMHVSDAMALAEVAGLLQSNRKPYRILNRAGATSFKELQSGPFILIGGMNNEWTLRLTAGLRFSFERGPNGARVADKQNPSNIAWTVDFATPISEFNRDYAIISRVRDPKTEQPAVIVAGIGSWGTQAAAEFVTNPEHLKKLEAVAPRHWEQNNLQVLVATDVIRGSSGPPRVLAAYFW
jgi:hypothetical protein